MQKTKSLFPDDEPEYPNGARKTFSSTSSRPKLKPIDRRQMIFRSVEIEKLIPPDHDARAIWEFVGRLDLSEYYRDIHSQEGEAGRSALDPHLLISIWIYAFSKGIRSAREVARLCDFDPAFQWLTGLEVVNHHSLSDFMAGHEKAIFKLMEDVLAILSAGGLVTMERVTQDGTKIKANASGKSFRREQALAEHYALAQEQIEAVKQMDEGDEGNLRQRKAAERAAREHKEKIEQAFLELEVLRKIKKNSKDREEARVSTTDPEARIMKQPSGGFASSYNVQISTDSANKIIVAVGVTQAGNDAQELIPGIDRMRETTGKVPRQVIADGDFTTKPNIVEAEARGVDLIGALHEKKGTENLGWHKEDPRFRLEAFSYHPRTDTFTCPAGEKMRLRSTRFEKGHTDYMYFTEKGTCRVCRFGKACCPQGSARGRSISRKVDAPAVVAYKKKMESEEAKKAYKTRAPIAEFPNAWLKEKMGLRQFRLRGLKKVKMEATWACIAYNIKQWVRLAWKPRLM